MTLHKIIDKICKCFRLAESSNPNEAAAALRQAVSLMQKYGITEEQVESYELLVSQMTESSVKSCSSTKPAYWIIALSNLVAEVFDCRVYISRSPQKKPEFIFIGIDNRPEVASYLYTILYRNLGRARAHFLKNITVDHTIEPGVEAVKERRRRANVFAQAWLFQVSAKVKIFKRNAQSTMNKPVDDYVSKKYGDTIPDYNNQYAHIDKPDYDDIIIGMRAAKDVNLLRPLSSTNRPVLAIAAV